MGWQGRGLRGDVPLPRRGLFSATRAASRGDAKGSAPPRVAQPLGMSASEVSRLGLILEKHLYF